MPVITRAITLFAGVLAVILAGLGGLPSAARADRFAEQKQRKIELCRAIPETDYSTGMIFNPPGFATLYHRSRCFQNLAAGERDQALCAQVKERTSWFYDGSGVSEQSCRARVAKRVEEDRWALAGKDFSTLHRLTSIRFVKNGNGRDFDLLVTTEGSFSGAYELDISLVPPGGGTPISVHRKGYGQGEAPASLRIWLQGSTLAEQLGSGFQDLPMTGLVTWQLEKTGSNQFYYDLIPEELRRSRLETAVTFADLPRW